MNRIQDIPPETLTPEQSEVFERLTAGRGRILGPYRSWIHSPAVASGMEHIGTYLNKKSSLTTRSVEFAEIEAVLGRAGVAEVLVLLGYYTSVALGMKVHEVPVPPQA